MEASVRGLLRGSLRGALRGALIVLVGLFAWGAGWSGGNGSGSDVWISRALAAQDDASSANAATQRLAGSLAMEKGLRDIKTLQRAYAQYVSAGMWQQAATLFTESGVLIDGDSKVTGIAGIKSHFSERYGPEGLGEGYLNSNLILSPVINIEADGETAKGRWRLVSLQGQYGESAAWEGGIYENTYRLEGGIWKIAELHYYPIYGGDYADGWRMLKEETPETVTPVPFHYDADGAGLPAPDTEGQTSTVFSGLSLAELNLQAQRLLDEDAVISLQNAFGYYLDRMLWDDLAELFQPQGTLELGHMGVYQGRDSIHHALQQFGEQGLAPNRVFDHLQLQPVVTLSADGQQAVVRGTELRMLGVHGEEATWGLGTYISTLVKVEGQWQFDAVHVYDRLLSDYDKGWAEDAQPARLAAENFAADAPVSEDYPVFPAWFVPQLTFPHPVTAATATEAVAAAPAGDAVSEAAVADKIRRLNAYSGAENVANAYGYYIDEFLWDGMADVFAETGWKELSYIGTYVGRERVRQSVVSRYGRGGRRANSMTYHQKVQPVISVAEDGRSARIRTRLFQMNASFENPGSYNSGIYENQLVKENGIWKIQGMDLDYTWRAGYAEGWAKVEAASSTVPAADSLQGEQAPDRPLRGMVSPPYPTGQVDMAFHYLNPVSGRRPAIYLPEWDYEAMGR